MFSEKPFYRWLVVLMMQSQLSAILGSLLTAEDIKLLSQQQNETIGICTAEASAMGMLQIEYVEVKVHEISRKSLLTHNILKLK